MELNSGEQPINANNWTESTTFFRRSIKFSYTSRPILISQIIKGRDKQKLFEKVYDDGHILHELLPPKRTRLLYE